MSDSHCTCPTSVYGGFKQGVGIFLGGLAVVGVPILLLVAVAVPAWIGSMSRAAAAGGTLPNTSGNPT